MTAPIYDVRLTLTRDGTWRSTVDGEPAAVGGHSAPDILRKTAEWMTRGGDPVPERRISVSVYLDPSQVRALRDLSEQRRVPQAALIREAIGAYLSLAFSRSMTDASPGEGPSPSDALPEEAPRPQSTPATSGASSDPPSAFQPGGRRLLSPPVRWICPTCGWPEPYPGEENAPGHHTFEPCPKDNDR